MLFVFVLSVYTANYFGQKLHGLKFYIKERKKRRVEEDKN